MKKLLLAAVAVFGLTVVNAQEVSFGGKAGVNFATVTGDETDGIESRTAFHVGVVAEIMISDKFSFQPELLYSAQGAKDSYSESESVGGFEYSYTEEVERKMDYLNLPLMAKYYVTDGLSIEAGPQIGFLLSSKEEYSYTENFDGEVESGSEEVDFKDFTSGIDFGLNFGLGYKLENGLNFGARYNLGLSNVNDFEGSDNMKNQNGVFQISVGYFFN